MNALTGKTIFIALSVFRIQDLKFKIGLRQPN
jgi:hypothetical protein